MDPYLFLVWWNCGYPASDAACLKGWDALKRSVGVEPEKILAATPSALAAALTAGGIIPEIRAERLKEVADRAADLKKLSSAKARTILKSFPGIADPGADRILLFCGISPVAAVPSNAPQVLVRICDGQAGDNYSRNYKRAQSIITESVPDSFEARRRAYLLLKVHGEQVCRRATPKCSRCPVNHMCKFR